MISPKWTSPLMNKTPFLCIVKRKILLEISFSKIKIPLCSENYKTIEGVWTISAETHFSIKNRRTKHFHCLVCKYALKIPIPELVKYKDIISSAVKYKYRTIVYTQISDNWDCRIVYSHIWHFKSESPTENTWEREIDSTP